MMKNDENESKTCGIAMVYSVITGLICFIIIFGTIASQIVSKSRHRRKWREYDDCGI